MTSIHQIKVLFDPQIFLLQRHGGISTYFSKIIREFQANPSLGIVPMLDSKYVLSEHALTELSEFKLKGIKSPVTGLIHLARLALDRGRRVSGDADLIHQTFYLPGFLKRHEKSPRAVTLFDMIPENTPKEFKLWNPHFLKKSYIRAADLVLSISNSSTKDMLDKYQFSSPVTATYLGVSPEFQPNLPRPVGQDSPYFLFVGNRAGYKDCETALRAFSLVAEVNQDAKLQLVGGGKLKARELKRIRKLGIAHRVEQQQVPIQELAHFYSNALALLYPTRYEGFGLPLVEAMASGIPIFASDTPVNREIGAGAGIYFTPGAHEQLASHLIKRLNEPQFFRDKIDIGLDRAREFTWAICAQKTAIAYKGLLEELQGKQK